MVNKKMILQNVVASYKIEEMIIPIDKQELMKKYLNDEITEAEFIHENRKRVKSILDNNNHK